MKKMICFLWFLTMGVFGKAQPPSATQYLQPHTSHFDLSSPNWQQKGAASLLRAAAQSDYLLLGEYHGSRQISLLTADLLKALNPLGYRHLVLEIGPHSAEVVQQLIQPSEKAVPQIGAFLDQYFLPQDEDFPIPFIATLEDARFLEAAATHGYAIWGVDQEYFSSGMLWSDQLWKLAEKAGFATTELWAHKLDFDTFYLDCYQKDIDDEPGFRMFQTLLNDTIVSRYFGHFSHHPKGQRIIQAIRKSWDIYDRNYRRGGYSHLHRVAYMRKNLWDICHQISETEKILVKTGSFHAAKGAMSGVYDLGSVTHDLERLAGKTSLNIMVLSRWYDESDTLEESPGSPYAPFRQMAMPDHWTLIDLRPVRDQWNEESWPWQEGEASFHTARHLSDNFDFLLIPPIDSEGQPNYSQR